MGRANPDYMEEPTPCMECGEWFELGEGFKSLEGPVTICEDCHDKEVADAEKQEHVDEIKNKITDLEYDLKQAKEELAEILKQ